MGHWRPDWFRAWSGDWFYRRWWNFGFHKRDGFPEQLEDYCRTLPHAVSNLCDSWYLTQYWVVMDRTTRRSMPDKDSDSFRDRSSSQQCHLKLKSPSVLTPCWMVNSNGGFEVSCCLQLDGQSVEEECSFRKVLGYNCLPIQWIKGGLSSTK